MQTKIIRKYFCQSIILTNRYLMSSSVKNIMIETMGFTRMARHGRQAK